MKRNPILLAINLVAFAGFVYMDFPPLTGIIIVAAWVTGVSLVAILLDAHRAYHSARHK
jgi:hypothetical protein